MPVTHDHTTSPARFLPVRAGKCSGRRHQAGAKLAAPVSRRSGTFGTWTAEDSDDWHPAMNRCLASTSCLAGVDGAASITEALFLRFQRCFLPYRSRLSWQLARRWLPTQAASSAQTRVQAPGRPACDEPPSVRALAKPQHQHLRLPTSLFRRRTSQASVYPKSQRANKLHTRGLCRAQRRLMSWQAISISSDDGMLSRAYELHSRPASTVSMQCA